MVSKMMFIAIVGASLWASGESITNVLDSISRRVTRLEDVAPGACTAAGTFCASCNSVSECIDLGNGDFLRQDGISTCEGGSCSNVTGYCTTGPNPDCDANMKDYTLDCRQIGLFPHPFNASKYFICSPNATEPTKPEQASTLLTCQLGYAYDVYSGLCRVKLAPNTYGDLVIPPCKTTTRGAIPNHPSMYYICLKKAPTDTVFSPQLFLCGNNQFYNNATKLCQERSGSIVDGRCVTKALFYDSAACGGYTECVNGSVPIKRTCSSGWYFDERKAACTIYSCLNVKY